VLGFTENFVFLYQLNNFFPKKRKVDTHGLTPVALDKEKIYYRILYTFKICSKNYSSELGEGVRATLFSFVNKHSKPSNS